MSLLRTLGREKPNKPFENINVFIENAWKKTDLDIDLTPSTEKIDDWKLIINDAVSNKSIGAPISNTSYEEVVLPSDQEKDFSELDQQKTPTLITRKDKLRKKLNATHKVIREEKTIPEWVFEDNLTNEDKKDLSEQPIVSDNAIQNDIYKDPALENSGGLTSDSEGITGDNFSVNQSIDSPDHNIPPVWVNELSDWETDNMQKFGNSLDDTQKIMFLPENSVELVRQAFISIEEGNMDFAIKCLNKVIQNNYKLDELANRLEDACDNNPSEIDLWITLVEVYKKLGLVKKSLETLEKAQHNLSF